MRSNIAAKSTLKQHSSNKVIATKKLIVQEYKDKLRNNIKSLNDNFQAILSTAKV